jgi:energy-coupling factor transporter ATP-binding protein EcfA2
MSRRVEFTAATKETVAKRAGYRCSFPDCDRMTIGPGTGPNDTILIGEAAHIFSASPGGPRGQQGALLEEIGSAANAIWLCRDHAKIVDARRGQDYPVAALLSYKQRQEGRIAREIGSLPLPFGWLETLRIHESPVFETSAAVHFGKATVVSGDNGSGKTTLTKYLATAVSAEPVGVPFPNKLHERVHHYSLLYRRPERHQIEVRAEGTRVGYALDDEVAPFNSLPFSVIVLKESSSRRPLNIGDRLEVVGMTPTGVEQALAKLPVRLHGREFPIPASRDSAEDERARESLQRLSAGEAKMLLLECAMTLSGTLAQRQAAVLIMDDALHGLDPNNRADYLQRLTGAEHQYQTVLVDGLGARDLPWGGWQTATLVPGATRASRILETGPE